MHRQLLCHLRSITSHESQRQLKHLCIESRHSRFLHRNVVRSSDCLRISPSFESERSVLSITFSGCGLYDHRVTCHRIPSVNGSLHCYLSTRSISKILTKNLSSIIVTLPWLISMALSLPPFFGWNEWETAPSCSFSLVYSPEFFWTTSSIVCSLNGLSFIAHFLIFFKIRKFYKRTRPLDELETEDKKLHKNIRGAKVMLIITIAFTICWTPFMSFSFAFANGYSTDFNLQETSHWLVFLGMLNSVINPVIYAWYKQDFRKACQKTCSRDSIQRAVVRIRQSNT
ncbi:unnamed protein product [Mytilus edulis]|uniref:G-protein coupled receptors family 1 profile domain-containing protein n=1 Tax=Mytilus edulis TaxID=6550 RepID=A0A8S3U9F0_MYTED|nr:unnamed protein product [Mytilus edulis]